MVKTGLEKKLFDISTILQQHYDKEKKLGLLSGKTGVAYFFILYGEFLNDDSISERGHKILAETIEEINQGFNFPTFCSGIAGIGWVLEMICEEGFLEINSKEIFSEIDIFLDKIMASNFEQDNYDFLHGYLGEAMYFLKRYQNANSIKNRNKYKVILIKVISVLQKTALENKELVYWESYVQAKNEIKVINLGLAHGMSSIINFLARLVIYQDFEPLVSPLLIKATRFILSVKSDAPSSKSLFPSWINQKQKTVEYSRLAWCYGDLGIGLSLWHAAEVLNDKILYKEAMAILKHSALRKSLETTMVKDAGLCHGAFGIMLIFDYLYKSTAVIDFKNTADYWLLEGLKMANHENGYAGYMKWQPKEIGSWQKEDCLLDGVAGIGLAILSYLSPTPLKWSQCLMIS